MAHQHGTPVGEDHRQCLHKKNISFGVQGLRFRCLFDQGSSQDVPDWLLATAYDVEHLEAVSLTSPSQYRTHDLAIT